MEFDERHYTQEFERLLTAEKGAKFYTKRRVKEILTNAKLFVTKINQVIG